MYNVGPIKGVVKVCSGYNQRRYTCATFDIDFPVATRYRNVSLETLIS